MDNTKALLGELLTCAEKLFVEMPPKSKQEIIDNLKIIKDRPDGFNIETIKDMFDFFKQLRAALDRNSEEDVKYCVKKVLKDFPEIFVIGDQKQQFADKSL